MSSVVHYVCIKDRNALLVMKKLVRSQQKQAVMNAVEVRRSAVSRRT